VILAIESATPEGSVALVAGDVVLAEIALPRDSQASATFLPAVDRLLRDAGPRSSSVTHVAVSAGPGSFTGLRVGMAAAKGFCFGWGVPVVPVPTLHALAYRFPAAGRTVCPVLDAKKKEVYAGLYRWEGGECLRLRPDMAIAPQALPDRIPPGEVFFCGEGARVFAPLLRERMGERALFPPEGEGLPRAGAVGILAGRLIARGQAVDARSVVPAYIRPSEAEVHRKRP
jgi:tRNA threonylcarbamoyladenosine biosynthesis protein TsaB